MVIIVDMLNGFLEPGASLYCGDLAREIIPHIQRLIDNTTEACIWVQDEHEEDDLEFDIFPSHCLRGSHEAQRIKELKGFRGEIISKQTISGFINTPLVKLLQYFRPKTIIVVGVCTDICVQYLVAGLRFRGYSVKVPANCVASFDQMKHELALEHMEKILGATILR